ncbi:hypothetical protein [Bombilactobacillus thymidiniphilus]|uniref:Uncharacterized protein n=1 Tax=Bombilactobacillus thymidiniphilus TaxID=2923363 RepID=A0ABY4PBQ7_9LACO|nr:hypothetical protein [Bombilactobacillus thymidiniphilus]UQS83050.1 hypothetical protein MOO47_04500 [Bombilactobacillus thymidiniphilus]
MLILLPQKDLAISMGMATTLSALFTFAFCNLSVHLTSNKLNSHFESQHPLPRFYVNQSKYYKHALKSWEGYRLAGLILFWGLIAVGSCFQPVASLISGVIGIFRSGNNMILFLTNVLFLMISFIIYSFLIMGLYGSAKASWLAYKAPMKRS